MSDHGHVGELPAGVVDIFDFEQVVDFAAGIPADEAFFVGQDVCCTFENGFEVLYAEFGCGVSR